MMMRGEVLRMSVMGTRSSTIIILLQSGTIFRGVNPPNDITAAYAVNRKVTFWAFSSCTDNGDAIANNEMFLGARGAHRVLFSISCTHGKDIRRLTC